MREQSSKVDEVMWEMQMGMEKARGEVWFENLKTPEEQNDGEGGGGLND